jgi:hypothetical protein
VSFRSIIYVRIFGARARRGRRRTSSRGRGEESDAEEDDEREEEGRGRAAVRTRVQWRDGRVVYRSKPPEPGGVGSDASALLCSAARLRLQPKTNLLALGCFCLCHLVMCRGGRPEAREAAACCAAAAAAAAPIRLEVYGWLAVAGSCLLLPLSSRLRRTWWCY